MAKSGTIDPEVRDLVARAQEGDGEAFAALYDRYVDQVYGFVLRRVRSTELAEDLTSDVFLRALRRIDGFRWQGVDIGAWLMTIARNRVMDHYKSARTRLEHVADEVDDQPVSGGRDDPEQAALAQDMSEALQLAMDELSDDHREILALRFVQGLSVEESAAAMGRSQGAIKALQYRALRALAALMKDNPRFAEGASG
jgi:RNA polymerase sigma-70 factor, ECF subfamily